jgi:light-regulated signal transduction histidine kinase (bacteriophytochrome)
MKSLMARTDDGGPLEDLGRASIQIVHDLKNQINGLKLYATFLRRRIEKHERPDDEQETINKLIAGLDRAANDLSTIVQYGREIELKKQPGFDVQKVMRSICADLDGQSVSFICETDADKLLGTLDPTKLTDALNWISAGAFKYRRTDDGGMRIVLKRAVETDAATIHWSGITEIGHDPFKSFVGSDEIRMSLAAKIIEAHGGRASYEGDRFEVFLPLSSSSIQEQKL